MDLGNDFVVYVSGLSHKSGDIGVLLVSATTKDVTYTVAGDGAWTSIYDNATDSGYLAVWVAEMTGSETSIDSTGFGASLSITTVAVFRGAVVPTASNISGSAGNSGATMPDPPSQAFVSSPPNHMAVAMGTTDGDENEIKATAQANYTLIRSLTTNFLDGAWIGTMMSYRDDPSDPEDPGIFLGGTPTSNYHSSATLILEDA